MSKLWKDFEREIARRLGGERIPVHSTSGKECDVSTPLLSIECKEREALPESLKKWMKQAETNCETGKVAIVIIHEKGNNHNKDLVILRLKDWEDMYGK